MWRLGNHIVYKLIYQPVIRERLDHTLEVGCGELGGVHDYRGEGHGIAVAGVPQLNRCYTSTGKYTTPPIINLFIES